MIARGLDKLGLKRWLCQAYKQLRDRCESTAFRSADRHFQSRAFAALIALKGTDRKISDRSKPR